LKGFIKNFFFFKTKKTKKMPLIFPLPQNVFPNFLGGGGGVQLFQQIT